jgi:urea transport system permease protein
VRFIALRLMLCLCFATLASIAAQAASADLIQKLATGGASEKLEAIASLSASGDASALPVLQALQDGTLHTTPAGAVLIIGDDGKAVDALTGKALEAPPEDAEKVSINNRVRRQLGAALASLALFADDAKQRLRAARSLQSEASAESLSLIDKALATEKDVEVKQALLLAQANVQLRSPDAQTRLRAVQALAKSSSASIKSALQAMARQNADGSYAEADADVRHAARMAVREVDSRLQRVELMGHVFSGVSLGSVLLLCALGLAITFGLMGIINMAHGEMLMIGAYATYVVQTLFRQYLPAHFDWYLLAAVPAGFLIAALVGMALERSIIRSLYGRPLETLLCTWGISLILIQIVRQMFGAQNVEVANPSWMSGGIALQSGLVMPYNRIVIIVFAACVVLLVWLLMNRTRLGLFVRAVTQNRTMADCVGVATGKVDTLTFGLGCGIAGLGGVALSQIGNVGPELGQSYIVDSFMVVVLGGVGQLAGTIIAATGLGVVNKFLEPYAGAVLGKILVLVFIIIFIQRRPQGLFAMKGRSAEANA